MSEKVDKFVTEVASDLLDDAVATLVSIPKSVLEEKANSINGAVSMLIECLKYDSALKIIKAPVDLPFRLHYLFLTSEIYSLYRLNRFTECKVAVAKWLDIEHGTNPPVFILYGNILIAEKNYRDAILIAKRGLEDVTKCGEIRRLPNDHPDITRFRELLTQILTAANEGVEKNAQELLDAETRKLEQEQELKKQVKQAKLDAQKKKRDEEEKKKRDEEEEKKKRDEEEKNAQEEEKKLAMQAKVEGKRKKSDEEGLEITEEEETLKRRKFDIPFEVDMPDTCADEDGTRLSCVKGYIKTNVSKLPKSFVLPQNIQIAKIEELVEMCSKHESLLNVQFAIKNGETVLVSEVVQSVDQFFKLKMSEKAPQTREEWWGIIKDDYWQIFRDIREGLMHLKRIGSCCGQLAFNCFVTEDGRGRVLPSLSTVSEERQDIVELCKMMKSVVKLVKFDDELKFLRGDLLNFFELAENRSFRSSLPLLFLLDHPYFWTNGEKVRFALKMRKLVKRAGTVQDSLNDELIKIQRYKDWQTSLMGQAYIAVWKYGEENKVRKYSREVDIIRYVMAVYTHVNERAYKQLRKTPKMLTDFEIENDLIATQFPMFYGDMYKCLCNASVKNPKIISHEDLMSVTTLD